MMNQLQKAIIEKTGHDFGFEYLVSEAETEVTLGSARHGIHTAISLVDGIYKVGFHNAKANFIGELNRDFKHKSNDQFNAQGESQLALLLQRASQLANSLPNQAVDNYEADLKAALVLIPPSAKGTEVERMVRQRIGQDAYRKAMLDYWGNACAVTGLQMPEVLRASHAKPWAVCETDAERLDVYNGFLLTANLDALFDRFLISFDKAGRIIISKTISDSQRDLLNIHEGMQLRWTSKNHESYLLFHRSKFEFQGWNGYNLARIENHKYSIEEAFRECFYIVPDYQREYVWTDKEVHQLFEDIGEQIDVGTTREYFIGTVLVSPTDQKNHYEVIDGQQRLTTFFLLLCSLKHLFQGEPLREMISGLISTSYVDSEGKVRTNLKSEPH